VTSARACSMLPGSLPVNSSDAAPMFSSRRCSFVVPRTLQPYRTT
jgi:hypothetical protein